MTICCQRSVCSLEVSQLQRDLATNQPNQTHHDTTYASLCYIQLMLLLHIYTNPSNIRAYPRGEQDTRNFEPDLCAVIWYRPYNSTKKSYVKPFAAALVQWCCLSYAITPKRNFLIILCSLETNKIQLTVINIWHSDLFCESEIRKTYKNPVNQISMSALIWWYMERFKCWLLSAKWQHEKYSL